MPRLDGLRLAARMKNTAETAGIPVVMATCKAFELSAEEARQEYGIAVLLPKPYNPRTYASVIKEILESRAVGVK
jgi:CheY-like chemotaxis protein